MQSWWNGLSFVRKFAKPKIVLEPSSWLLCIDVRDRQHIVFNTSGLVFTRNTAGLAENLKQQLVEAQEQVKVLQAMAAEAGHALEQPKALADIERFAKFLVQADLAIKKDGSWWPCQLISTTNKLEEALAFGEVP